MRAPIPGRWISPAALGATGLALLLLLVACGGDDTGEAEEPPAVLVASPPDNVALTPAPATPRRAATVPPSPTAEPRLVSLDWLIGGLSVPGLGGGVASPEPDSGLHAAVSEALAGFGGKASVVVHNLEDGRYTAVNEGEVYYAASTFKAAVLLEAYRQRDAGEIDFAKTVALEEKYAENDLGTLEYLEIKPNDQVSIQDAVRGMIVVSDTPLALLLIDQLGSNKVDQTIRSTGAAVMTINDRALPTTALDLAQLMTAIAAGHSVTPASRDEMLGLLAQEWFREGIVAGVPDGTTLGHKSGRLDGATHDAAVVWGPGGPYVITVLTDGSGAWAPIAAVSAAVWNYFEANP
jgi:beta-lactamase class A